MRAQAVLELDEPIPRDLFQGRGFLGRRDPKVVASCGGDGFELLLVRGRDVLEASAFFTRLLFEVGGRLADGLLVLSRDPVDLPRLVFGGVREHLELLLRSSLDLR